jgi:hypothetical protein
MSVHPVFADIFAKVIGAPAPRIPEPMRPDDLDVIHMDNDAIEEVRDSAEREENAGRTPRMDYGRIADREAKIKGAHDDDRR